jgi:outer membrane protein OmpA-like peptidoglycan-associated protein
MGKRIVVIGVVAGGTLLGLLLTGSAFYGTILPRLAMPQPAKAAPPAGEALYPINPTRLTAVPRVQALPGTTVVTLAHGTSGTLLPWALANMGAVTDPGSSMMRHGLTMRFRREEPLAKRIEALRAMAAAFKEARPAAGPPPGAAADDAGAQFFVVGGDASSWVIAEANRALQTVDPQYEAEVVGFVAASQGEDALLGPPEWSERPQSAVGAVVAGVPFDSAWGVLLFWCARHAVPLNADQAYYDPKALNFVETQSAETAAGLYIDNTPVERVFLAAGADRRGRAVRKGAKGSLGISGVTTRTLVAKYLAAEQGGLVTLASTKQYPTHAPSLIVGLKQWNQLNQPVVADMLAALFEASQRIDWSAREVKGQRLPPKSAGDERWRAAQYVRDLVGAGTPDEWYDAYGATAVKDDRGEMVEIGGVSAATLRQTLWFFGLDPAGPDRGRAVYSRFVQLANQYDVHLAASPPAWDRVFNSAYLQSVRGQCPQLLVAEAASPDCPAASRSSTFTIPFGLRLSEPTPEGERVLAEVAAQLKGAGKWRVEIHAYTDSFGPPATNMELSRQRGERVLGWLRRELGTALPVDVRVVPHGANDLLVQDLVNGAYVPELMAQNRRVVLKISPE